jgi:predicted ATPase/DNA-binding XRE family transcriptional regulator
MALAHPLSFGDRFKRERLAQGLTQEALAERAGLSTRAISDLERGINRTPRKETLRLLADALQLSVEARSQLQAALRRATSTGTLAAPERWPSSDSTPIPLAGRARELARLAQHLVGGAGEAPPLLLLAGEPGIGKSRLLRETAQRAFVEGWTVLEGGCHRQSGQEPYTPMLDALAGYLHRQSPAQGRGALAGCAWLVRLLPELAGQGLLPSAPWKLPPEQERRLMFAAVRRYLANVAGPAGTVLVLDDLQWAGADTLDLLSFLVRAAVDQPPLRVAGAYRNNEVTHQHPLAAVLADLASAQLATQIEMGPLEQEEAARLLTALFDEAGIRDDSGSLHMEVMRRGGGLPFFLVSCTQAVRPDQSEGGTNGAVPWDIVQSIRQRLSALPKTAQELLGVASVVGRVAATRLLVAVMEATEGATLDGLDAACAGRLLVEQGDSYQFAHDLVREVVQADLSAARRRALHRRVAEELERQPGELPLEQLAYHWVGAGEREKAAGALERAGDHAQGMHAFAEAEGHYRDCLIQLDRLGRVQERAHVFEKLGNALQFQDYYEQALEVFAQAVEGFQASGDQEGRWHALAQIGWVHAQRGTFREGFSQLEPVIEGLEPELISPGLAALHAALSFLAFGSGQYNKQLAFAHHAVRLAQTLNDTTILIQAQHMVSVAFTMLGHVQESLPPLTETIRLAEQVEDLWKLSEALGGLSKWHLRHGDLDQSKAAVERAFQAAEQLGWLANMAYMRTCRGDVAFYRGEWIEAQATALGHESGGIFGVGYPAFGRGQLALVKGQREAAAAYFAEAIALAERGHDLRLLQYIQRARAEEHLLTGHCEAARAHLAPLLDQSDQEELGVTLFLPLFAWATLDHGDRAGAEALLSACLRRARKQEALIVVPDALRIQARLERLRERWAEAEVALEEALTLCRTMRYPYAEAKALYEYGQLHMYQGGLERARERFEAALAICARLGERLYAEQIEQVLARVKQSF